MQYRVLITETNIVEERRPRVFRYVVEADTDAEASQTAHARFTEQNGREPAARAIIDAQAVDK